MAMYNTKSSLKIFYGGISAAAQAAANQADLEPQDP
jgi:hypothetical protein